MITITPNLDQVNRAAKLYEFQVLNNSLTHGDGNGLFLRATFLDHLGEFCEGL